MSEIFEKVTLNGDGVPEVSPQELHEKMAQVKMIDVRRPEEFVGELGHIEGAELVTLQTDLEQHLEKLNPSETYVFICRSGARSSTATEMAIGKGLVKSFNLYGGMIRWNALDFPISKNS
jgi:hydroxyacylglutathione hydrolase